MCEAAATPQGELLFGQSLRRAFASSPKNRAAGPAGSRYEHWSWMPQHEGWDKVVEFVQKAILGGLPPEAQKTFLGSRIVAGSKGGGGVRPFTIGHALRRMGMKAVARMFQKRVDASVAPYQYGVGMKAGAEVLQKTAPWH